EDVVLEQNPTVVALTDRPEIVPDIGLFASGLPNRKRFDVSDPSWDIPCDGHPVMFDVLKRAEAVAELVPRVSRTNDVADSHYSLRLNSDRSGARAGAGAGRARTLAQRQLHRANEGGLLR